jgi:release factor glutamine methyltransferase
MTLKEWHRLVEESLSKASFENASQEAKWLLAGALERDNSFITLNPTYIPSPSEGIKIQEWFQRRLKGEHLSRIKGIREFWSLPFHLNEHTLDPRPETEGVVEGVLKWVGDRTSKPWRILDLGTGSGCLLISLLHELKQATGAGIDINEKAVIMARANAVLNGVEERATFLQGNWGENLATPFDIIVSNPPYIPLREKETLDKGVLDYDPPQALFGGADGLECYRILSRDIKPLLAPNGIAVLEIGTGQRGQVEKIFQSAGFKILFVLRDLAGVERVLGLIQAAF